jgi:hypothetical protein
MDRIILGSLIRICNIIKSRIRIRIKIKSRKLWIAHNEAVGAGGGSILSRGGSQWSRKGSPWGLGGTVDQWLRILVSLMRNWIRIRIRVKVKSWIRIRIRITAGDGKTANLFHSAWVIAY